jgi:hypothetical protein
MTLLLANTYIESDDNVIIEYGAVSIIFIHHWFYRPSLGPCLLFSSVIFFTQTIGPFGREIGLLQHRHGITAHSYQCLEWDSNSRSRCSRERRQVMT